MASGFVDLNVGRGRNARQVSGELVSGNYFQVLGVRAELGRTLLPSDEVAPGRHPVVVLSDGMWRRDFGADPDDRRQDARSEQLPADHRRRHRSLVPRHDRQLRRRSLRAGDDGRAGRHRQSGGAVAERLVGSPVRPGLSSGLPQAWRQRGERRRPGRRDLDDAVRRPAAHRCRAASESRAVLAVAHRRPALHDADDDRAGRDGSAGPGDRVREHRGSGARARSLAAWRDCGPPGAWRDHERGSFAS